MKKALKFIITITLLINILCIPFTLINISQKSKYLINKSDFIKKEVVIDSLVISSDEGSSKAGNRNILTYYFYYGNEKKITSVNNTDALFPNSNEIRKNNEALNYLKKHNDSLLIWYHPRIDGQFALEEDTDINIDGYLTQITINILLLSIALYSIIWQIKKWIKLRKK
ncbi:hypothetical protein JM80_2284 [Cellulophaga sp. RHA_52]|uniref:hypothetical protein n=1 Tax=Cellulophaga sp. RHA_52 TaxID=1250036 RepID=UPI00119AF578|nr:hypothetical protein [Cellulophaga sp. RHA_52]TVZ09753.1 hypothetical protein JM80_2284 [Cellulophaga sp. RHA_52]